MMNSSRPTTTPDSNGAGRNRARVNTTAQLPGACCCLHVATLQFSVQRHVSRGKESNPEKGEQLGQGQGRGLQGSALPVNTGWQCLLLVSRCRCISPASVPLQQFCSPVGAVAVSGSNLQLALHSPKACPLQTMRATVTICVAGK